MSKIRPVLRIIDIFNDWLGKIVSILILGSIAVMTFEVITRYVFNAPTEWSFETSGFLFCAFILLGGGYTLLHDEHVRSDIIYQRFSVRQKALINIFSAVFLFLFCGVLLWGSLDSALTATRLGWHSGTPWNPPMAPVLWTIPTGAVLLMLQALANLIRDIYAAISGREEKPAL